MQEDVLCLGLPSPFNFVFILVPHLDYKLLEKEKCYTSTGIFMEPIENIDLNPMVINHVWLFLEDVSDLPRLNSGQNYRSPPCWLC